MNYRHVYHAGNFADVFKHVVLALVIERFKLKDTPFRVIDTHAGVGFYALNHGPAEKTGEWRAGIAQLAGADAAPLPGEAAAILAPYLDLIAAENAEAAGGQITRYPGSPLIARRLMRRGDQLVVNELHPDDRSRLAELFAKDGQVKVLGLDGWIALKSLLPPKERRGIVLIDPPFEEPGELIRITEGLGEAVRRFEIGTYLLWYPIKDPKIVQRFHRAIAQTCPRDCLVAEIMLRTVRHPEKLNGCGLVIVNPPWQLEEQLQAVLPLLADRLGQGEGAGYRLERLVRPRGDAAD
jgi:23S rRNA (adenine2030-N6)-methyltransferase